MRIKWECTGATAIFKHDYEINYVNVNSKGRRNRQCNSVLIIQVKRAKECATTEAEVAAGQISLFGAFSQSSNASDNPPRYGASLGGALCYINNPTLRLFSHTCLHLSRTRLHTTSDGDQTRRHKKHKQDKHHHHGDGAARPSSGVDLMNPCRLRGGRPCACSSRCRRRSDLIDSIN